MPRVLHLSVACRSHILNLPAARNDQLTEVIVIFEAAAAVPVNIGWYDGGAAHPKLWILQHLDPRSHGEASTVYVSIFARRMMEYTM